MRKGDWKLIRIYCDNRDQTDRFKLYNLNQDLGEINHQAARMPEKVKELNALIDEFLQHMGVPRPNPNYRGA